MKKHCYIAPLFYILNIGENYLMQTISTEIGSEDATDGGRSKSGTYDFFWEEEDTDK